MDEKLSAAQEMALTRLGELIDPSIAEWGRSLGLVSRQILHINKVLVKKGMVKTAPCKARSLTKKGEDYLKGVA